MRKPLALVGMALVAVLATSAPAVAKDTTCNGTMTGQTVSGDLVVPTDGACTIQGTTVGGDVEVGRNAFFQSKDNSRIGGDVEASRSLTLFLDDGTTVGDDVEASRTFQVFVFGSTIGGHLHVSKSTETVNICGNEVDGRIQVRDSGRDILVGDPKAVDCAGNTVLNKHRIRVEDNEVDVELVVRGNTVEGGDLEVNDNSGPADKFVEDNKGGDSLECRGNEQPFTASGNTGWNHKEGQCAEQPVQCRGTLTGATVPDDLVVPDDESCTIVGTTVGDDVKVGENAFFQADNSQIGDDVQGKHALTIFINTDTTVGGDIQAKDTTQVFVFNATVGDDVEVSRTTETVQICGNVVNGNVGVKNSGRDILIGDPLTVDCGGNTFNGDEVEVEHNSVDVELVVRGNTFQGGDLEVDDNTGPAAKFVQDNTGGRSLECSGNQQPFTGTPNAFVEEDGQCAEI
jgi:hypothetical protein